MSKRIHIIWILSLLILSVKFVACSKDPLTDPPTPVPPVQDTIKPPAKDTIKPITSLTSFLPLEATGDDPVKIFGKNFGAVSAVSFGGKAAKSFTLISDSVILAYVSPGSASGNIAVTLTAGVFTLPGFTYYTPQVFVLYGTTKYATLGPPSSSTGRPLDSSGYKEVVVNDTCSFELRKTNPYDTVRNWFIPPPSPHQPAKQRSKYADSANYVLLSGVQLEYTPFAIQPYSVAFVYKFVPKAERGVFAKIEGNVITIPPQTPMEYICIISGSGTIKNGVITLQFFVDEWHGHSKTSTLSSK
jgi:hypothetical protein